MIENPNPGPWRLVPPEAGWPDGDSVGSIEDANGNAICDFGNGAQYYPTEGSPPGEPAATLMLAAPEMEAALKAVTDGYESLVRSDYELSSGEIAGGIPESVATARALLARFDDARAKAVIRAKEDAERAERSRIEHERLSAERLKEGPGEPYKFSGLGGRCPPAVSYVDGEDGE